MSKFKYLRHGLMLHVSRVLGLRGLEQLVFVDSNGATADASCSWNKKPSLLIGATRCDWWTEKWVRNGGGRCFLRRNCEEYTKIVRKTDSFQKSGRVDREVVRGANYMSRRDWGYLAVAHLFGPEHDLRYAIMLISVEQ